MSPLQWGIVIVVIAGLIWLFFWLRSYFREDADVNDQPLEMLTQFSELHQEGGLSDDEFRLIRSRLASQAKAAIEADRTKTATDSSKFVSANLKELTDVESGQSPAQQAIDGKEEKSERISDDKTD